jgi:hypothetical protein
VVGASVVVNRLSDTRRVLQASGLKPVAGTSGTILLPPELTHGICWTLVKAAEPDAPRRSV